MPAQQFSFTSVLRVFHQFTVDVVVPNQTKNQAIEALAQLYAENPRVNNWQKSSLNRLPHLAAEPKQLLASFLDELSNLQADLLLYQFVLALKESNCSTSTIKNYRSDIKQFFTFAEDSAVSELLTKPKLRDFVRSQREKGLKDSSITRKLKSIAQFGQWVENEQLAENNGFGPRLWLKDISIASLLAESSPAAVISTTAVTKPVRPVSTNSNRKPVSLPRLPAWHHRIHQAIVSQTQQRLLPYFNLALLILFFIGVAFLGFQQLRNNALPSLAFPSDVVRPNRVLSFQGRLTDTAQNPITTSTPMRFYLYDALTLGNLLWDSGSCNVDPDQDGIFSTGLGSDCGSEITSDVFTENANVWLEVEVDAEILTPRQPIQTVAYALNSETVQGFPINATESATRNTLLVMNEWGEVVLGENSPIIKSVSGTFSLEGESLVLQTVLGSDGDITLSPDGTGGVIITSTTLFEDDITVEGNAVLTGYLAAPGATFSATYDGGTPLVAKGGPSGTANIQEWQNSAGSALAYITSGGNAVINQTLGIGADSDLLSLAANALTVNGTLTATGNVNSSGGTLQTNGTDRISNGGNLQNIGTTQFNTVTYSWPGADGSNGYLLSTNGSGTLSWFDPSSLSSDAYWDQLNGALFPFNSTVDLLIGGQSSASAKFKVLNMNGGTPVASISANSGNIATYLTGDGTLATTNRQTLTIGNSSAYDTTGNVLINPNGTGRVGIGTTTPASTLDVNGRLTFESDTGTQLYRVADDNIRASGSFSSLTQVLTPLYKNLSGSVTVAHEVGGTVYLGSTSTGTTQATNLVLNPSGNVGIGTTSPGAKLQIVGDLFAPSATFSANYAGGTALIARGGPSGTANIFNIQNSGGSNLAFFDSAGNLTLNAQNDLRLADGDSSNYIAFQAPNSVSSDITYTFPGTVTNGYILQTDGSGVLSWIDPTSLSGASYWGVADGALFPINSTFDLLVGGQSSASAKFKVLNMNAGTPVASVSANSGNISTYLTGDGTLATTNRQTLTIGNSSTYNTTGDVAINPNGTGNVGIGTSAPGEKLEVVGNIISKGTAWTAQLTSSLNWWTSVTYGNGLFVAVSASGTGDRVMTSPDGINWTSRTSAADNFWRSVTYGNGMFVAVSDDGTGNRVMTSPDGINWTSRTSAADNGWTSVTYGNGMFVAVSDDGTGNRVMTSPDGINWTSRTSAADNAWLSVTYGNGLFVAVAESGSGNRVMTSPDGITWTSRTSAANNSWTSITYGNGLFVAVSQDGTGNRVMTSPNGINWTIRTTPVDNSWRSVTYGNGLFVAVSTDGTGDRVMTSPDGITWTSRTSAANSTWFGVAYGNGVFAAIAFGSGDAMTSGKTDYIPFSANNTYQGGMSLFGDMSINAQGDLRLADSDSSNYIALQAPSTVGSNLTYTLPGTVTDGYVMRTDGSGTLSWTDPSALGLWRQASGAISPINNTFDLLVGGQSSASAKFKVLNMNTGTPVASISANSGNIATYLTGNGTLATTNRQNLVLGNSSTYDTTGHVTLNPNGNGNVGIGVVNPTRKFQITHNQTDLTSGDKSTQYIGTNVDTTAGNSSATVQGLYAFVGSSGSNTVSALEGIRSFAWATNTNTASVVYGLNNNARTSTNTSILAGTTQNVVTHGSGTTTNAYGFNSNFALNDTSTISSLFHIRLLSPVKAVGATIGTAYGLYMDNQNIGTTNFAIVTNAGNIVFNEGGDSATNLRVEGDTDANLLYTNASTDRVGIGTTSPGSKLHIIGDLHAPIATFSANYAGGTPLIAKAAPSQTADIFQIQNSSATSIFEVDSAGRLGIGGVTTGYDLQIYGSGNVRFRGTSGSNRIGTMYVDRTTSGTVALLNGLATAATHIVDYGGGISGNYAATTLRFWTAADVDTLIGTERMTIDSSGNVGIGDTTPNHKLDVDGNIGLTASSYINWGDTTGTSGYGFRDNAGIMEFKNSGGGWASLGGTNYWQLNDGALSPFSLTADINLGDTASSSAKISLAGSLTRGKALAIFNQTENQDIIAASASGTTRFRVDQNGYVHSQRFVDLANNNYFLDPAATDIALTVVGKTGIGIASPEHQFQITSDLAGKAMAVLNYGGTDQDILVASNSGVRRFSVGWDGHATLSGSLTIGTGSLHLSDHDTQSLIQSTSGNINLQTGGTIPGADGDSSVFFSDSSSTTKGAFDTQKTVVNVGDGADGDVTISSDTNLNTDVVAGGRSYADGIAYRVHEDTATASGKIVKLYDTPNGIAAGDEVLLINMQGTSADYADVGNYEFFEVASVNASTKEITFTSPITRSYTGSNFSIINQKVIIQRVPNYEDVTVSSPANLTASAWDGLSTGPTGTAGYSTGIVAFRASGTLVQDSFTGGIHANALGYRGGGCGTCASAQAGEQGESIAGLGAQSEEANFSGGGGAPGTNAVSGSAGAGGGGQYSGQMAINVGANDPVGGIALGDNNLNKLFLGGGGGGPGDAEGLTTGRGGAGGGIVIIGAGVFDAENTPVFASGGAGTSAGAVNGEGGGGGGGVVMVEVEEAMYLNFMGASGGAGATGGHASDTAGNGGNGYVKITYVFSTFGAAVATPSSGNPVVIKTTNNYGTLSTGNIESDSLSVKAGNLGALSFSTNDVIVSGDLKLTGPSSLLQLGNTVSARAPTCDTTTEGSMIYNRDTTSAGALFFCRLNIAGVGEWASVTATATTPDLAEYVRVADDSIAAGDVVSVAGDDYYEDNIYNRFLVEKTDLSNASAVLGIISTNPGITLNDPEATLGNTIDKSQLRPLALAGRVPVNVATTSATIRRGDLLTVSDEPGKVEKATQRFGHAVGKALGDWSAESGETQVMAFIQYQYFDQELRLSSSGEVAITPQIPASSMSGQLTGQPTNQNLLNFSLTDSLGQAIERIVAYSEAVIANLQVGRADVQNLFANQATIEETLISPVIETTELALTQGNSLDINLKPTTATNAGTTNLRVLGDNGAAVATIDSQGNTSLLGQLLVADGASIAGELTTDSLTVNQNLNAKSARLETLESRLAQLENIKSQTADIVNATISGTLYANDIDGFADKVAAALEEPSLLSKLLNASPVASNAASINQAIETIGNAGYATNSASLGTIAAAEDLNKELAAFNFDATNVTLLADATFINTYFKVNGHSYIGQSLGIGDSLFVTNQLKLGHSLSLTANSLSFDTSKNNTFQIQPSGQGTLSLMAGLLTLNDQGQAIITGDLTVTGNLAVKQTLLTNLVQPGDFTNPFQVQLATRSGEVAGASDSNPITQESRFEIVNELGTPVATISAQGKASFENGIGVGINNTAEDTTPNDDGSFTTNKTAGTATIKANTNEIVIKSSLVTDSTLLYLTPNGSTGNQVLFIKNKTIDNPDTPENEAGFIVGFEQAVGSDISFNWWMVN